MLERWGWAITAGMDIPPDFPISMADIRAAGHCARVRGWCQRHDLYEEFKELVRGGTITAAKLLATGDPYARKVVERAFERQAEAE